MAEEGRTHYDTPAAVDPYVKVTQKTLVSGGQQYQLESNLIGPLPQVCEQLQLMLLMGLKAAIEQQIRAVMQGQERIIIPAVAVPTA